MEMYNPSSKRINKTPRVDLELQTLAEILNKERLLAATICV
jgi:hypothetical protein